MISFIRKRLGRTILTVLAVSVAIVMGTEIYVRLFQGTTDRIAMMTRFGNELAATTYAGIKHPMSVGDASAIKKQLLDIREATEDVEVFICDFDQTIVYATHEDKLQTRMQDSINNREAVQTLTGLLQTGEQSQKPFEEEVAGKRYLVTMHPIMNHPDCFHCHGASRKVLGGMIIKMNSAQTYSAMAAGTKRSILISLLGIGAIVTLIYAMLVRLVSRPIEVLADQANRFADGDMSVSVDVRTDDEIGMLGRSFNYMVTRISSFSRELESEVARRTLMLREKTLLLERANRELRELDSLKSSFLANMSHELRTPMNSIIGYTDLLIDGVDGPVNEEQGKSLRKIAHNADHLLQLINDILDMSKIEAGRVELDIKSLDIRKTVEQVASTFQPAITRKGLTLTLSFDDDVSHVYADEEKVKQILLNLISNAVKFTAEGGIVIQAGLSSRGVIPGESPLFAQLCIEDTGVGIKEEDIEKLFDKFSQLDMSTIRQYEGTGLGLSIARGLVVLHKGVIWVSSAIGKGSRFCFTLPIKKELLEKPATPIIEERMAEGLAAFFKKPVELFLSSPTYAGKPIQCWEYVHCGQTSCPAYGSPESRCWLMHGTHCKGIKIAAYPEKVDFCKGCEIIERLMLESAEFRTLEAQDQAQATEAIARKKIVMAIDDNPEAIEIIRKYLGEEYHVVGLFRGESAVDMAQEIKPAVITLDIMMPEKDGWQVLQELKSRPETQDIPVIIISIVDEKQTGFSLGAADYLVKPVEKQVLLRKIKNIEKKSPVNSVLIVDGEPDSTSLIADALKKSGYQVTAACNGEEAIKAVRDSVPDLIILDLTMSEVNGFDVIDYMKSEQIRTVPLIVLTQKDLNEVVIRQLNGRIRGVLQKGRLSQEAFLEELRHNIDTWSAG